jgi:hypothetical protein
MLPCDAQPVSRQRPPDCHAAVYTILAAIDHDPTAIGLCRASGTRCARGRLPHRWIISGGCHRGPVVEGWGTGGLGASAGVTLQSTCKFWGLLRPAAASGAGTAPPAHRAGDVGKDLHRVLDAILKPLGREAGLCPPAPGPPPSPLHRPARAALGVGTRSSGPDRLCSDCRARIRPHRSPLATRLKGVGGGSTCSGWRQRTSAAPVRCHPWPRSLDALPAQQRLHIPSSPAIVLTAGTRPATVRAWR